MESTFGKRNWIHPIRNISLFLLLSRSIIYSLGEGRRIESVEERLRASPGNWHVMAVALPSPPREEPSNCSTPEILYIYIYIHRILINARARLRASNRFVKQPGHLNLLRINKPLETDLQLVPPFPSPSNILLNTFDLTPALLFYLIFHRSIFPRANSKLCYRPTRNRITGGIV